MLQQLEVSVASHFEMVFYMREPKEIFAAIKVMSQMKARQQHAFVLAEKEPLFPSLIRTTFICKFVPTKSGIVYCCKQSWISF